MIDNKNLSKQDLLEIYDSINKWEWDDRLGEKPEDWDYLIDFTLSNSSIRTKKEVLEPYMEYIKKHTTEKERTKYHHLKNCGMTRLQHEIWWIKSKISKIFNVGLYSRKNKQIIKEILEEIAVNYVQSNINKIYNKKS